MKKIKVLHIIKTLNLGGAETNLLNLIKATDTSQFEIHVAYSFGGEIENRFQALPVKLFKYAEGNHKIKSLASFGIIFRLVRYILENKIQIIHTHNFNSHIWGLIAGKLAGIKVVEHVHDFRYLESRDYSRKRGIHHQYGYAKFFRNVSDRVFVLTKQNHDFLIDHHYYPDNKIREVQNGIEMDDNGLLSEKEKNQIRAQIGIPEESFIVFTAARIAPEKNIDLIFRIVSQVILDAPRVIFLISGDGPLWKYFSEITSHLGLENHIRFLGFREDIHELLSISDIFLLPSFLELHSIAILEAMSMKVPVITSKNVGCHDEFIQNWENGVLLDPFSDQGWAEAIIQLSKDDFLRKEIGRNGYALCKERFNLKTVAKKIEGYYAELTGS